MLSTLSLGVALGLVSFVSAQADPAQLALTEAQYEASGFAANTYVIREAFSPPSLLLSHDRLRT